MSAADHLASGKGRRDENFPVASWLIAARQRPLVLAFYRLARLADDVADHPTAIPDERLAHLAAMEATLLGRSDDIAAAVQLREALAARGMTAVHMLDLIAAFRRDVVKNRTADWADLMDYCRLSAAPVGRFVLDVHGEDRAAWPASDALCAALQVINHLQDCGRDYRDLDRVYVPADTLEAADLDASALGADRASPALLAVISGLARRARQLLATASPLAGQVRDRRLAVEIGVIQALAVSLAGRLTRYDPLSQRVHHKALEVAGIAGFGAARALALRLGLGKRTGLRHS
jgi:squalene synthase HpnC